MVDSVLGATVQARRWCDTCARETERPTHDCGRRHAAAARPGVDGQRHRQFSERRGGRSAGGAAAAVEFSNDRRGRARRGRRSGRIVARVRAGHARRVDVHVVDRAHFPRPKPCAEYLSPEASRILAAMGALERVEASGAAALAGVRVRAPNGARDRRRLRRGARLSRLSRSRTVGAPRGARRDSPRRARARRRARDRGRARHRPASRDAGRGDRRVGARRRRARETSARDSSSAPTDCARSSRDGSGVAHTLRWPRRLALVTHYANVADVGEHGEMHVERDGYVGIADVGNGLTTVALVVPARRVARDRGRPRGVSRRVAARATAPRAALCARDARDAGGRDGTVRVARAARVGARAPRSSATPPTSSIRSPAKGSTRRCAAARCSREWAREALVAHDRRRRRDRALAAVRRRAPARVRRQVDRGARHRRRRRRRAADQSRRARPVGAKGSGGSPHRRDRQLRPASRGHPAGVSLGSLRMATLRRRVIGDTILTDAMTLSRDLSPPDRMIDADTFRAVLGRFATGITIVTARDERRQRPRHDGERVLLAQPRAAARADLRRPRRVDARAAARRIRRSASAFSHRRRRRTRGASPTATPSGRSGSTASRTRAARAASCCSTTRSRTSSAACVQASRRGRSHDLHRRGGSRARRSTDVRCCTFAAATRSSSGDDASC